MVKKTVKQSVVILAGLLFCAILLFGILGVGVSIGSVDENGNIIHAFAEEDSADVVYLSDLQYDTNKKNLRVQGKDGGTPTLNEAANISVKIEGAWYSFKKGIYAHAPSYVAYNISEYSDEYKYFTAYAGLRNTANSNTDGIFVGLQTSTNGTNWSYVTDLKLVAYNANAEYFVLDISGVKWIRVVANQNKGNSNDHAVWADAKLSKSLDAADGDVPSLESFDAKIKAKGVNADLNDPATEKLILQRELVSRVGQYALKRFMGESDDNKEMFEWLFNDLDSLREFVLGGTPFKGNYYNTLTVLSNLYKSYKKDLDDDTLLNNKFMPDRTFGELCRTMMFSVALTHDGAVGSYLQGSLAANKSEPNRRYAIFKYMYQTERFVATRNADGSWKSETMTMFGSLRVEEMRWLMCSIIDDESIIWLNDYVQTRINASPNNVGNLYTPHSYVRYTDPNYNNPVFYAEENYDYFNGLFSVDSREVKVGDKVIIPDDNYGNKLEDEELIKLSKHPVTNIAHYGLWDAKYNVPAGEGEEPYVISVSRTMDGVAKLQKVWMNFNNKFKTGSVCGGISKSGVNIRTSRGIPANVIGQPGHAAILYYSQDANGNGSWKIDNDVGGWLAATKGERHLLGWGNASWQRNSGGTVVYFHLAQTCLNDYDNFVKAEEYTFLAKVYQGDLNAREALYEKALKTQILNLDAWYGLAMTYKANAGKTAADFGNLAARIADTLWNHPVAMHCLFRLFTDKANVVGIAALQDPVFTTQIKTIEINALAKAKASGSTAAKSKVNYLLGIDLTSDIADFSFDGENAGCIVWAGDYSDGSFTWKYSLDGKITWKEVVFTEGDSHAYQLSEEELSTVSADNDIYVYIVGASPDNAYKIDVAAKPTMPDTLYANDWENRVIGVDGKYEWRYCSSSERVTETGTEVIYTPTTGWIPYAQASPDCSGNKIIEVRIKGTAKNPASDGRIFTFTADQDTSERKYISINYLSLVEFSSESKDSKRPNYAVNAIDGNAKTYWHTDYALDIKKTAMDKNGDSKKYEPAYLIIKLDVPRYISALEFVQFQYNPNFSIFAKNVTVYVSEDGENWQKAATREGFEEIDDLKAVHFNESVYGQYVKLEMTALYETKENDGKFTTVSLVNLYEDTTKTTSPSGEVMQSLSEIAPSKDAFAGLGEIISVEQALEFVPAPDETETPSGTEPGETEPPKSNVGLAIGLSVAGVVLVGAAVAAFFFIKYKRSATGNTKETKKKAPKETKKEAPKEAKKVAPKETKKEAPKETKKEAPKETKKEAPKETKKEAPKETKKEAPKEAKKEAPKETKKEAPKETKKVAPKETKKETPKETKKDNTKAKKTGSSKK